MNVVNNLDGGRTCAPAHHRVQFEWIANLQSVCVTYHSLGNKKTPFRVLCFFGTPKETRTPDSAVRGRRLNRLTMGADIFDSIIILQITTKRK